jgi:hypothetical protein
VDIIYLWLLLFAVGGLVSFYLYRANIKRAGLFLGFSSLVFGILGGTTSFVGVDGTVFQSIWVAYLFALSGTAYLALKARRVLLLLIFPSFFLLQAFIPSLPLISLFAIVALTMGGVDATDFSRLNITACMKNGDRPFRILLVPFSRLENIVRRGVSPSKSRAILFASYLLLALFLIALSILAYLASGGVALIGIFLFVACTAYLSIARQECAKGLGRLEGSSQGTGPLS